MKNDMKIGIVDMTKASPEIKADVRAIVMSSYLGDRCRWCKVPFATLDDLKDAVWTGSCEAGRISHQACWDAADPAEIIRLMELHPGGDGR